MKTVIFVSCVLILCLVYSASGLTCRDCSAVRCASPESLNCALGAIERKCGCCHECIKGEGEECGGSFSIFGTCNEPLICVGGYLWIRPGHCKTPEDAERDSTSTTPHPGSGFTPTTRNPFRF